MMSDDVLHLHIYNYPNKLNEMEIKDPVIILF